jgi:malate dehydrogenase (oxaloacetate-decarboxylating)
VINEEMKIAAARTLAGIVIEPVPERILPDPLDKTVGIRIGEAVAEAARRTGVCR